MSQVRALSNDSRGGGRRARLRRARPTRKPADRRACRSRCARTASTWGRSTASRARGPATAVRAFQRSSQLAVDGVPGATTRRALGRLGRPLYGRRTLAEGRVGWDVSVLQYLLARHGVGRVIDGYFGAETGAAVRQFQRRAEARGRRDRRARDARARSGRCLPQHATARQPLRRPLRRLADRDRARSTARRSARSRATNRLDPARPLLIGTRLRMPRAARRAARRARLRQVRDDDHGDRDALRRRPVAGARASRGWSRASSRTSSRRPARSA